jgi:dUTP pyrophosphatase
MINIIKYSILDKNAKPPFRKNSSDAGADFFSVENIEIPANSIRIVHTGISVEIPEHYMLLLKPKSRNNHLIAAGIIDSFYDGGEVLVKVTNIENKPMQVLVGDAICQGIYIPIENPRFEEVPIEQLKSNNPRSGKGGIVNQTK